LFFSILPKIRLELPLRDHQYLRSIILSVDFASDNRKIGLRGFKRIGFPGEAARGYFDRALKLRSGFEALHPELFSGVIAIDLPVGDLPQETRCLDISDYHQDLKREMG